MTPWTRRSFLAAAGRRTRRLHLHPAGDGRDARARRSTGDVDEALAELYQNVPGASELGARAQGILVIPQHPQGRLLRLRRLRRGRAADRPGQGRLLLAVRRSASA